MRIATGPARGAWGAFGAGLACWAGAELWWAFYAESTLAPPPADGLFVASYVANAVGIVLLARGRGGGGVRMLSLDGLIAALASAALVAAVVFGPILDDLPGDAGTLATNLAYVSGDIVLLGMLAGALVLGGRIDRLWVVLGASLLLTAIADGAYLSRAATDTYVEGGVLDSGWPVAALLMAVAAWQPLRAVTVPRDDARPLPAVPLGCAVSMIALVLGDELLSVSPVARGLAGIALLMVVVRLGLTHAENRRLLADSRREARVDALTGLGNRRALCGDLESVLESGDEHVLVLFDLDGFKGYNDAFGHPAGDALLSRLGDRLQEAVAHTGRGYRLGGDEFCVLARTASDGPDRVAAGAGAALRETGEGFEVTSSHGAVALPAEASDPTEALRVADRRMYAHKRSGRPDEAAPLREALLRTMREGHPDLGDHMDHVAVLADATARDLGLPASERDAVVRAAELHDIGKVAIPDAILAKAGPLDADEWAFIARHTIIGERILDAAPAMAPVARIVRSSHERWDGAGYPDGLAGEAIPLGARVVLVCDAFDVMTSRRPYQEPMAPEAALAEVRRGAGTQFDPAVVDAFSRVALVPPSASSAGLGAVTQPTSREPAAPPPAGAAARARPGA